MHKLKKLLALITLVIIAGCTNAQNSKNLGYLPNFHILTTDSVKMTSANLKRNKPVLFIYFSPDCSHCQHMMYELKPRMKELKNVQVVMITFTPQLRAIRDFYRTYGLSAYPNFIVGTEGYTYEMQQFWNIKNTPYTALYDKRGKIFKAWEKAPTTDELLAAIKKV